MFRPRRAWSWWTRQIISDDGAWSFPSTTFPREHINIYDELRDGNGMGFSHLQHSVSTSVKPIALGEFIVALANVLKVSSIKHDHGYWNGTPGKKIGLAISGGVDSMALALLCSRLQRISPSQISEIPQNAQDSLKYLQGVNFQAFVVDHGAREGSYEEAKSVSRELQKQGISTMIRQVDWPQESSIESPNFESLARHCRFRALGKACRKHALDTLLLAHHEDDQVETVFMRLAAGHRSQGLTGIKGASEFPECYGVHAVHESGGIDDSIGLPAKVHQRPIPSAAMDREQRTAQLLIEHGGIRIYRPLLNFSKARLRATCEDARMKWFEDHTNKDPTLTMRNAVRQMYSTRKMPLALTKPAILALTQKCREKAAIRLDIINTWLAKCSISRFETRSSVLAIKFPELNLADSHSSSEQDHIATSLLRKIIMLVSPEEHVYLTSLIGATRRIFPELIQDKALKKGTEGTTGSFTVGGVLFQPQPKYPRSWLLSRQPHSSVLPRFPAASYLPDLFTDWSQWTLYDGRFWIRIRNLERFDVMLSHFKKEHLKEFSKSMSDLDRARLQADLKTLAPGDIRWTLPAIVSERQALLALPTLDYKTPDCRVEWEVRYKKVDLEGIPFVEGVA